VGSLRKTTRNVWPKLNNLKAMRPDTNWVYVNFWPTGNVIKEIKVGAWIRKPVAFYCPQHKVHLCNDHALFNQLLDMPHLSGECIILSMLTIINVNTFVYIEHDWTLLFQPMKHGTNTSPVA
jgi:hypothetical protein